MKPCCVVPARLHSTRFPKKLLAPIKGQPVIRQTILTALEANCFEEVICFTDAVEISDALSKLPCKIFQTPPALNGTERIAMNSALVPTEGIVNLQGDEPFFPKGDLRTFAHQVKTNMDKIHVAVQKPEPGDIENPNRVKVYYDSRRSVQNFFRTSPPATGYDTFKLGVQAGLYGYNKSFLAQYLEAGPSPKELKLSHEMLRIWPLPPNMVFEMKSASPAVDAREDLIKIKTHESMTAPHTLSLGEGEGKTAR